MTEHTNQPDDDSVVTEPRGTHSRRAVLAAAAGAAVATAASVLAPLGTHASTQRNTGSLSRVVHIPAGQNHLDVDVQAIIDEEGLTDITGGPFPRTWACVATLEIYRWGVYVAAARPHFPSERLMRIRLNKAVSKTTPVAFVVYGVHRFPG
jgi:hypothetical protein